MNIFFSLVLYMAIGGVCAGLAHNSNAQECGQPQYFAEDAAESIVIWPALIALYYVINEQTYAFKLTCNPGDSPLE